jgi:hypothetical protein
MNTGQEEKIPDLLSFFTTVLGETLEMAATAIRIYLPVSVALLIIFLLLERKRLRTVRWWWTALLVILLGAVYYLVIAGMVNAVTAIDADSTWAVVFALWIVTAFLLTAFSILRSRSLGITGPAAIGVTLLGSISFGFLGASLAFAVVYLVILLY